MQRDVANLGYTHEDVCNCVQGLEAHEFVKTLAYDEATSGALLCDVYETEYCLLEREQPDPIYLKLFLKNGTAYVCSFHLP